jgi:nicotinamidase-related amidase
MIRSLSNQQRAALIVNECQLGVIDARYSMFPGLAEQVAARGVIANIARLTQAFRAKGFPVIYTPAIIRPDFADIRANSLISALTLKKRNMARGTVDADYAEALRPTAEDFVIERSGGLIAFNGTSLDVTLRRLGIETVVLTGVSTNIAMPGNTMTAVDLGYHVVIPEDCIAGADAQTHATIVENQLRLLATITTANEIIEAISPAVVVQAVNS